MELLNFIFDGVDRRTRLRVVVMGVLSGTCNASLLLLIKFGAEQAFQSAVSNRILLLFLVVLVLYTVSFRYAAGQTLSRLSQVIAERKLRMVDNATLDELRNIELRGGMSAYTGLLQDTETIEQATMMMIRFAEGVVIMVFVGLYLLALSPIAFFVFFGGVLLFSPYMLRRFSEARDQLQTASIRYGKFYDRFSDVIRGFKELKADARISKDVKRSIHDFMHDVQTEKLAANSHLWFTTIFSYSAGYLLLFLTVYSLQFFSEPMSEQVYTITIVLLYLIPIVLQIINAIPAILGAESAVRNFKRLEAELEKVNTEREEDPETEEFFDFSNITLNRVEFSYRDSNGAVMFRSGPNEFELKRGELIFVVGGNGSGKSTFLKLLTGLYRPDFGEVRIDGARLEDRKYPSYRAMFSSVFADFHLFDRLYGVPDLEPETVRAWLRDLDLDGKTAFEDGRFTVQDLSTGQRKRLAFIATVIRNRPICLFDELAADQDPEFRKALYTEVLPKLRDSGRTVIVVSHDDAYFHTADRVVRLADGLIVQDRLPIAEARDD